MSLEEELEQIMDDAHKKVMTEGLDAEAKDFRKMESYFDEMVDPVLPKTCELWYLSTSATGEAVVINEEEEGDEVLRILHKKTYDSPAAMFADDIAFMECKLDDCVGIIVRSIADDVKISMLMTPRGAHLVFRDPDNKITQKKIKKQEIHEVDMKFLTSMFNACFTW